MIFKRKQPDLKQIWKDHREELLKLYAAEVPQGDKLSMEKALVDLNGKVYYRFTGSSTIIPLERMGKMQDFLTMMSAGLDEKELTTNGGGLPASRGDHAPRAWAWAGEGSALPWDLVGRLCTEMTGRIPVLALIPFRTATLWLRNSLGPCTQGRVDARCARIALPWALIGASRWD